MLLRLSVAAVTFVLGCASEPVVPPSLQGQLDRTLTFTQLKESPTSYRGRIVVFGGEVLSAKRLKEGTRIEVLQVPLDSFYAPGTDRTSSQGRFLALQKEFLDPATLPPGTRVTVTGEVTGATTLPLDETEYTYPLLEIKSLKVWPPSFESRPNYGPYNGPYWGRWGPYPYWW